MGQFSRGEVGISRPSIGATMRISRDREELARMQIGQISDEINRKYAAESIHIQFMPRGGGKQAAEAKIHIARITEIAEAWVDIYLAAFASEGLVPDARDVKEMEDRIDQMLANRHGNDLYRPPVSTYEVIRMIPTRVKFKLRTRVKEMELEARSRPAPPATSQNIVNVHGDNQGNIQVGGEGNTQTVNEWEAFGVNEKGRSGVGPSLPTSQTWRRL
jgi:hypothetical protein